jgi:hypothetical protein
MSRQAVLAAAAVLLAGWALTYLAHPWSNTEITDIRYRHTQGEHILDGQLPYRGLAFEYPPLAAPILVLPALPGWKVRTYEDSLGVLMFLSALLLVWQCGRLASRTGGSPGPAMLAAGAMPFLLGAIVRMQFDLVPVVLLMGGLLLLARDRAGWGFAWLGAGTMTKAFPALALPPAVGWLIGAGRRDDAARAVLAFAVVISAAVTVAVALSAGGFANAARYQLLRPVQVESAQATVLFAVARATGTELPTRPARGSISLVSELAAPLGFAFLAVLLAVVASFTWLAVRAGRLLGSDPPGSRAALALAALGSVLAFAALGRVISPQYLVWTIPLLALAVAWREWWLAAALTLANVLTLVEFPALYGGLVEGEAVPVIITAWRNVALIAAVGFALAVMLRRVRGLEAAPAQPA